MATSATRRQPPCSLSEAIAIIKPPIRHDRDAVIAFFYESSTLLLNDYDRVARWKRVPGLRAYVHTIYLEKDFDGVPYINFGWRRIPRLRGAEPHETPKERIAVRVVLCGENRGKVLKQIRSADSLRVIFHQVDLNDLGLVDNRTKRLYEGTLWRADGTELIELRGISIFGRLIRPRSRQVEQ